MINLVAALIYCFNHQSVGCVDSFVPGPARRKYISNLCIVWTFCCLQRTKAKLLSGEWDFDYVFFTESDQVASEPKATHTAAVRGSSRFCWSWYDCWWLFIVIASNEGCSFISVRQISWEQILISRILPMLYDNLKKYPRFGSVILCGSRLFDSMCSRTVSSSFGEFWIAVTTSVLTSVHNICTLWPVYTCLYLVIPC